MIIINQSLERRSYAPSFRRLRQFFFPRTYKMILYIIYTYINIIIHIMLPSPSTVRVRSFLYYYNYIFFGVTSELRFAPLAKPRPRRDVTRRAALIDYGAFLRFANIIPRQCHGPYTDAK